MAAEGCFSGWLWKKKNDASKTKFIGGHNKRFFTLDFASEVFFYAHSDKEKKVSAPTAFADLREVSAQPVKRTSFSGMMSSTSLPYSLALKTSSKEVVLFAGEEPQIAGWVEHLSRAIEIGKARRDTRCTSRQSAVSSVSASTGVPSFSASGQITPPSEPEAMPAPMCVPPMAPPAPVIAPPEHVLTQEPAQADALGVLDVSPDQPAAVRAEEGWAAPAPAAAGAAYGDKSAGLSLHERLAQLQFSDSDSESDEEGALGGVGAADALVSSVLDEPEAALAPCDASPTPVDLVPAGYGTADARERPAGRSPPRAEQPASPPPCVESWDSPSPQKAQENLAMVRESSWDNPAPHEGALKATLVDDMVVRESSWDAPSPKMIRESSWDK